MLKNNNNRNKSYISHPNMPIELDLRRVVLRSVIQANLWLNRAISRWH